MIGQIEEYKDIIEDDKLNNEPFKKENAINILEYKTMDIDSSKRKDKNNLILKEEKKYKEKNKKNNNNIGSERCDSKINSMFGFSESEIKTISNYIDNKIDADDLSTTRIKKKLIYKKAILSPFHLNTISFVKKYDNKTKEFIVKDITNNVNIIPVKSRTNPIGQNKDQHIMNKKVKINDVKREKIDKDLTEYNYININKNNNNIIQSICSIYIGGNSKKCIIF